MRLLGTIVGWFFFAFFLLFALGAFLSGGILSGIFFLILAVLCSPLRKKIFEHLPDGVNRIPVKIGAGVLALILSFGFFPGSETTETSLQDVAVTADESTEDTVITERDRAAELAEKEAEKRLRKKLKGRRRKPQRQNARHKKPQRQNVRHKRKRQRRKRRKLSEKRKKRQQRRKQKRRSERHRKMLQRQNVTNKGKQYR